MKKFLFLCMTFFFAVSCAMHEGAVQRASKSYFKFSGNLAGAMASVDDNAPFALIKPDTNTSPENFAYQVSPGKHTLVVSRDGVVVVKRVLFLEDHGTMEVIVP